MKEDVLKNIPSKKGVYLFKDKTGNVLYVGKAVNLKERIKQHFKSTNPKIQQLIETAHDIEYILLDSEAEALLKEAELIKKFDPIFNQLLRDDTQYFYVGFTKENYPKVFVTHQPHKYNAEFIGPFTEGSALRKILKIIRKEIPFCTCSRPHLSTCLNAHLGLCYGWCCRKNEIGDRKIYLENIKKIKEILTGNLKEIKKKLLNELENYLRKDDIERAVRIKNQILAIDKILEQTNLIKSISSEEEKINILKVLKDLKDLLNLDKIPYFIEAYDISHYSGKEKVGIRVVFKEGKYDKSGLRKFRIRTVIKADDPRMIYEVLKRRFNHPEWGMPDLILIDGGKIQLKFALQALKDYAIEDKIKVIGYAKPNQLIFYNLQKDPIKLDNLPYNLKSFIKAIDKIAHRAVIKYHRQLREKKLK